MDQSQLVEWSPEIRLDLDWWLNRDRLELGISLEQVSPQLELWSDASDVGWGAHLDESVSSGLWAPEEVELLINLRELLAIERALLWFAPHLVGSSVAIFADNYGHCLPEEPRRDSFISSELHRSEDSLLGGESSGCDFPTVYYGETQRPRGFSTSPKSNFGLRMDSEAGGLQGSVQEVAGFDRPIRDISKSPMFYIFFSLPRSQCSGDRCSSSGLGWVAGVCLSSLSLIPAVLKKLRSSSGVLLTIIDPYWPPEAVVSGSARSGGRRSGRSSTVQGPSASATLPSVPSGSVQAVASCLETNKRFTRAGGLSKHVAQ